ncbi:enoyl-CoA hydratase/isomerase family protein [Propioniciclava tarda]|uniref:3-hydroxyisobutyryl-CoA hydrolase n=1 Tax=Propioniciclava tarda TaxID=433330 RepID=A0A4Q9KKF5_PROTD|nr:enoyl-CoA hydratase/isomerase family protein [Propioniciclava tarda]TBT94350.1 enoyl-CoA hydratase/isomerase family protein [Propioniciclava tarda]SMO72301.1 enoyl-CoA hydratase [Propioniciclava tarda]
MSEFDEVLFTVADGAGRITLNRPRALNALSVAMCEAMHAQLDAWASDDAVERVELRGAGDRALCAGADIRALRAAVADGQDWLRFFEIEYALDAAIARYPKPYVACQSGIVMGGGLGVSAHGSRRIVDASSRLAMPEVIIGFTPDVGIAYYLGRASGELGTHVALTGDSFGAGDALALGLADEFAGEGTPSAPLAEASWIGECYVGDDAVEIVGRLAQHPDPDARAAAETIRKRCPLSVAVTLEAVRRAASMAVDEVLAQDLALVKALIPGPDFAEGVRAQVVDKDFAPRWQHDRLEDVSRAEVLAAFDS